MEGSQIDSLRNPELYPEQPAEIVLLQTHLSVIVLVGDWAYKFKKSIRLPFADFSTLCLRRAACEEELRLNRRLCPEIYVNVVAWTPQGFVGLSEADPGKVIDYAVKMKRLPQERMLDVLLEENAVRGEQIVAIARRMMAFHREAPKREDGVGWGAPDRLREFALANFVDTRGKLPRALHGALERHTQWEFDRILPLLWERAAKGLVVDGHGDLHARNICLLDEPVIYDCIEFDPGLRWIDVAAEHAFLVMDLRYRGHPEWADLYLQTVLEESGDETLSEVIGPLLRYRAMVRANVSAIAAAAGEIAEAERQASAAMARRYLRLAAASAVEEPPHWLLLCGLPASGKSVLASELVDSSGGTWALLSSDRLRKELAGVDPQEKLPASYYEESYSQRTYEEMLRRAVQLNRAGKMVVLDANFRSRALREHFRRQAAAVGIRCLTVWVELDEGTALERLRLRGLSASSASDADAAVYTRLQAEFEPPGDGEGELLRISGLLDPPAAAQEVLAHCLKGKDVPAADGPVLRDSA